MTSEIFYIVDWDIPAKPSHTRRQFYRRLHKLRDMHVDPGFTGTFSVLVTRDKCLAQDVFELAKEYGRTNIYEARMVDQHKGRYFAILPPWPPESESPGE